jgi:pyridoxamine 5'-phosphate oxidase
MAGERLETLDAIEDACWHELARAAHERSHDWHVMVLATVDGDRADARSVVLRDVDSEARSLLFYTDSRSAKVEQLRRYPGATLVGWHRERCWQLRLRVQLAVETSGLEVSSRWARVKLSTTAGDYLGALPPGTAVQRHQPERGTREHFAVVEAQVREADWLELCADGHHRRARLAGRESSWLVP